MRFVWSAVLVAGLAVSAYADEGDGDNKTAPATSGATEELDRIKKLETELQALKADRIREAGIPTSMTMEAQEKAAPKSEPEFKASFTDGFHIKSTDGNFDLHIGGRWEEEYRYTFNRISGPAARTSVNSFYVREAFISVDGTLFKNWGFKLNGDFTPQQTATVNGLNQAPPAAGNIISANSAVSTGAIVEEAYVEWKELKEFRLLFGSFKQPVSMETTDSPRFAALIQRSPMARFMPNFDTGIKGYGSFADSTFTYETAVTNGRSHLSNQGRDQTDDNDGKEYDARITVAPFVTDKDSFLKGFRVGAYATFAHEGQANQLNPAFYGGGAVTSPGTNIATNELAVTYLALPAGAGYLFVGDRYRVGGEATYAMGPFMVRGEMMQRHDEVHQLAAGVTTHENLLKTMGYYCESSFVITGEDRIPNARIVPKNPFCLADGGMGAFEVAARFGAVSLDPDTLRYIGVGLGRNGGANSNRAESWTFGMNWWPVQNVKFCIDYVGEYYGSDGVTVATGVHHSHVNGMLAHFQVDF